MALLKLALVACLLFDLSTPLREQHGKITVGLPPLTRKGAKKGSGVVKVPVKPAERTTLTKRQDSIDLQNVNNAYLIQCSIGTPPQLVYTQIDTGSSDLWVDPVCANANSPSYCAQFPVYDPDKSSTVSDAGEELSITYGTGSVDGEYLIDNIVLGGASLSQAEFGWAETSSYVNVGIMGIGLGYGWTTDYYNLIDELYVQGYTNIRAFSVDLMSIDVAEGTVIFGGIDSKKYIGSLYKSPMIQYYNSPDGFPRYWFYMTSVGITKPGAASSIVLTTSNYNQAIFPDSGATLSQLPSNLFNALISYFPTAVSVGNGVYTIDCSIRNQAGTIDFGFGPNIVHVSYHEWFWKAGSTCYFGGVSNDNVWSLGDSFMRSAYIVYDQDNFNIHIAQAANCGTNVLTIGSGANAVPSVSGCPKPTSTISSKTSSKTTTTTLKTTTTTKTSTTTSKSSTTTKSTTKVSTTTPKTSSSTKSSTKVSTTTSKTSSKTSTTSKPTSTTKASSTTLKTSSVSKTTSKSTSTTKLSTTTAKPNSVTTTKSSSSSKKTTTTSK